MRNEEPEEMQEFRLKYGEAVTDDWIMNICECVWKGETHKESHGVTLSDLIEHDVINKTATGYFEHDGQTWYFEVEDGNWVGTRFRAFGGEDSSVNLELRREPPARTTLVPANRMLRFDSPKKWAVYLGWRKEPWFSKLISNYAYDRHFAPGGKTEGYYRQAAQERGLIFALEEDFEEMRDRADPGVTTQELVAAWNKFPD